MNEQKLPRAIGTLGLVFVLFFSTSGGPYSTETLIHSVGPGLGLLILALVPLELFPNQLLFLVIAGGVVNANLAALLGAWVYKGDAPSR